MNKELDTYLAEDYLDVHIDLFNECLLDEFRKFEELMHSEYEVEKNNQIDRYIDHIHSMIEMHPEEFLQNAFSYAFFEYFQGFKKNK